MKVLDISQYVFFAFFFLAGCDGGQTWRQFASGSNRSGQRPAEARYEPLDLLVDLPGKKSNLALAEGEEVVGIAVETKGGEWCWGRPDNTYFFSTREEKLLLNKNAIGCKLLVTKIDTTSLGTFEVPANRPGLDVETVGTTKVFSARLDESVKAQVTVERSPLGHDQEKRELVLSLRIFSGESAGLTFVQTFTLDLPVNFDPCIDDRHPITGESVASFEFNGDVIKNIDITTFDKYARIVLDAEKRIKKVNINLGNPDGRYCLSMTTDTGTIKKVTTNLACGAKLSGLVMDAGNRLKKVKFVGGCGGNVDGSFEDDTEGAFRPRAFNAILERLPSEILSVTVDDVPVDFFNPEIVRIEGQTLTFMDPSYRFRSAQTLRVEYRSPGIVNPGGGGTPTPENNFDPCVDSIHPVTKENVQHYTFDARVIKKDQIFVTDRLANVVFTAFRRVRNVNVTFDQPNGQYCLQVSTEKGTARNVSYSLSCGSTLKMVINEKGAEGKPEIIAGPACQ